MHSVHCVRYTDTILGVKLAKYTRVLGPGSQNEGEPMSYHIPGTFHWCKFRMKPLNIRTAQDSDVESTMYRSRIILYDTKISTSENNQLYGN